METLVFLLLVLALVSAVVWFVVRARSIRQQAMVREAAALESLLAATHTGTASAAGEVVDTTELDAPAGARAATRLAAPPRPWVPPPEDGEISQILSDDQQLPPLRTSGRAGAAEAGLAAAPLRTLVLAWFEARGYRLLPVAPTAWPIEGVLVHSENVVRSYAFVVQPERVTQERISALLGQAAELDLRRVALVAENGAEPGVRESARRRHVRLIDRPVMEAELAELPRETAARIVAAARAYSA